ncbi:MAG: hypothetical protein Q8S42_37430 [Archangium sp.]|nr:hypothetical protein [Archangium sp.]
MTTLRTVLFVAASTMLLACGTPEGSGTGGGNGSQTCTTNHSCTNGACTCTGGSKGGQSCCNPDSSTCSTSEKCPDFCRTCM